MLSADKTVPIKGTKAQQKKGEPEYQGGYKGSLQVGKQRLRHCG